MKVSLPTLTSEQAREHLDTLMKRGEEWALEIGQILQVIQEKQFYRDWGFRSLKAYLETTYGISRPRGYQLIDYAKVMESLPEKVSTVVDNSVMGQTKVSTTVDTADLINERHARVLKDVPEDQRAEVLADAAHSENGVTTETLKKSAKKILNASETPSRRETPKPRDETGWIIPDVVAPLWQRQEGVRKLLNQLGELRGAVRRVMEAGNDPLFRECDVQRMLINCDDIHAQLKLAMPYAICPYCHTETMDVCQSCKGRGVMSKFKWDHTVPEEMKRMRALALEDEKREAAR